VRVLGCKSKDVLQEGQSVDTQTRHDLKKNSFVEATASSMNWLSGHRSGVLQWVISAVVVVVVLIGALIFWNVRSAAADSALGAALDTYSSTLAQAGDTSGSGTYATAADRSKAANQQFVAVAQQYGMMPAGAKAHYFAGVTYQELGQTSSAETELKKAASCWNRDTANLAKLALAGVYHQTARDSQAIDLYNELISKPSETVSSSSAQLALADLYDASGKQDQARTLWAKVKDADKDGVAGAIAAQKLGVKE
jgi:tetratricopeptide (TPR) repeat protein